MTAKKTTADNATTEEQASMTFEQAMESLESIVAKLESGDVPLETAIELFQEGMRLSGLCGQKLEQVERRIEMLVEGEGGTQRKPFAPSQGDS
ncbi:exodeoxyribonuclease VII small subunit [Cohnella sp. GCM10027633]|uniref:exodeoxyribonuclease VII small subunit n=1 Tax=unclassified Cohnella TaxID=2636738 RepID=UPI00362638C6